MRVAITVLVCVAFAAIALEVSAQAPADSSRQSPPGDGGAAIFARDCVSCHDGAETSRAPKLEVLRQRSPEAILSALTAGGMRPQGARLTGAERRAVAEFVTGRAPGGDITGAAKGRCTSTPPLPDPDALPAWTGWAPSPTNTRLQPAKQAGLTADDVPRLSLKWAFGFPDATSAWSQPTVAAGRLFVGSQNGTVYSLDATSGCIYWTFTAKSGVRTALTFGRIEDARGEPVEPRARPSTSSGRADPEPAAARYAVYFGDTGANVYALDAASGRELWSREMDTHRHARITGSPTLYQGRLFVPVASIEETAASQQGYECCTFRGSLNAIDAGTGAVLWRTFTVPEPQAAGKSPAGVQLWGPSGVGIWSAPTIDAKRNLIYAATGNAYSTPAQPTADAIVAFDPTSGAIKWIHGNVCNQKVAKHGPLV